MQVRQILKRYVLWEARPLGCTFLVRRWPLDGAGVAAISILDKEHCNWPIRGPFLSSFFFTIVLVLISKPLWVAQN